MNDQNTTPQIPVEIQQFLESILQEANMSLVDESLKNEMINELFIQLDQHIASVVLEHLPQDKVEEFIKLNEEQKPQLEIEAFLRQYIPAINDVMANAFSEFRQLYLEGVDKNHNQESQNQE